MGNIDWLPIAELPEDLKDGRAVLLAEHAGILGWIMSVGKYEVGHWFAFGLVVTPSHFAEINEPKEG